MNDTEDGDNNNNTAIDTEKDDNWDNIEKRPDDMCPSGYADGMKVRVLRAFVRKIWTDEEYANLKEMIITEVGNLAKEIYNFVDIMEEHSKDAIERRFDTDSIARPGKVRPSVENIVKVVNTGNIREQMTLINEFGKNSCDLYWDAMFAYLDKDQNPERWESISEYFDENDMERRIAEVEMNTGYTAINLLRACGASRCKENKKMMYNTLDNPSWCHISQTHTAGPVATRAILSRINEYMEKVENGENIQDSRFIQRSDILPELSDREISWLSENKLIDEQFVNWQSGYVRFSCAHNSVDEIMAFKYGRLCISGPSQNTELHLDIARSFKGKNLFHHFIATVIWQGNPPDHSLNEMLYSTKCAGLGHLFDGPYDVSMDPYDFLERQIKYDLGRYGMCPDSSDSTTIVAKATEFLNSKSTARTTFFVVGGSFILGIVVIGIIWKAYKFYKKKTVEDDEPEFGEDRSYGSEIDLGRISPHTQRVLQSGVQSNYEEETENESQETYTQTDSQETYTQTDENDLSE